MLGHTRWASVGIISQPNAHPLNSEEVDVTGGPYVTAVLNGDVDNFADLKAERGAAHRRRDHHRRQGDPDARRRGRWPTAPPWSRRSAARSPSFEGSVAIAASAAAAPDDLLLALRGSGQALYVGLAEDSFIVASEPYGVVEETETLPPPRRRRCPPTPPTRASRGQVMVLDGARRRHARRPRALGLRRHRASPVGADELATPRSPPATSTVATAPHFLLKEIGEAPASFRKTLRGKLVDGPDGLDRPPRRRRALARGREPGSPTARSRRVIAIGQGTAAVAGRALAEGAAPPSPAAPACGSSRRSATELSGLRACRLDMADTLVVAVSQSGTTTDTNRTVDLVRARGGARGGHREPAQQRPHRQAPTACSTPPTGATWR